MNFLAGNYRSLVTSGLLMLLLPGCAGQQLKPETEVSVPAPAVSAERAAAILQIRQKAADARAADAGPGPDIYQSNGPPERKTRTYAEIKAIQAELKAIATAAKVSSNTAELAALRRRADELEALRRKTMADAETGTASQ